jgi:hypothetical protein
MEQMPAEALKEVAAYFQVLSEPTRLQILNLLRSQERNVGELAGLWCAAISGASMNAQLVTALLSEWPAAKSAPGFWVQPSMAAFRTR